MKINKLFITFSGVVLIAALAQLGWSAAPPPAQGQASANSAAKAASSAAAMASTEGQSAEIKNGTKISTELMSNMDARTAKQGDKVVARVTKNVKQHGKVVIHKGDKLVGHVTSVQNSLNGKGGSSLGVRFNQLVQGNTTTQLNTVLTSVLSARGSGQAEGSESMGMPPMPAPVAAPAGGGGGRGGLLGGVGSTVGSTMGSTVGAAGSTLGEAGGTVGATAQNTLGANSSLGLATPVRQIHIGSSASAESTAGGNSTLSTRKGDLRLESGTQMRFRVAADNSVQKKQ
jgi:hypothetical protein